jgi:hypothetical protein
MGDTLTVTVTVLSKGRRQKGSVEMDCQVVNQKGERGFARHGPRAGTHQEGAPAKVNAPQIQLFDPEARFKDLLALGKAWRPCAVRWCTRATPLAQRRHGRGPLRPDHPGADRPRGAHPPRGAEAAST